MNKQRLQVSSLCGTPFLTYLLKHSPQIYRAQYTDAIVVSFPGTLTRQLEINDNIWNSLLLWERLLFPCELVYIHLNTSPCTWTVQTAKDHKKKTFFQTRQLCHGAILMSDTLPTWRQFRKFKMLYIKQKGWYWAGNLWKIYYIF